MGRRPPGGAMLDRSPGTERQPEEHMSALIERIKRKTRINPTDGLHRTAYALQWQYGARQATVGVAIGTLTALIFRTDILVKESGMSSRLSVRCSPPWQSLPRTRQTSKPAATLTAENETWCYASLNSALKAHANPKGPPSSLSTQYSLMPALTLTGTTPHSTTDPAGHGNSLRAPRAVRARSRRRAPDVMGVALGRGESSKITFSGADSCSERRKHAKNSH